jgi:hypothetical protein
MSHASVQSARRQEDSHGRDRHARPAFLWLPGRDQPGVCRLAGHSYRVVERPADQGRVFRWSLLSDHSACTVRINPETGESSCDCWRGVYGRPCGHQSATRELLRRLAEAPPCEDCGGPLVCCDGEWTCVDCPAAIITEGYRKLGSASGEKRPVDLD